MASYIQGLTDNIQQVPLYQLDTQFLQQELGQSQAKYNQGKSALNEAYASIQNAPLTGNRTREMRDKYLEESQAQLQEAAGTDLSDPANQVAAQKIFEPFWKDQSIIWDSGLTKSYQQEMQKGINYGDSKRKAGELFENGISLRYLDGMREQIAEADGDVSKLQSIEQRRYTPMADFTKYLNDIAKDAGKVISVNADGAYIQTTENGPASLVSWNTFAQANLGKFSEEFRIMGIVDKEDRMRVARSMVPGISSEQASAMAVEDAVDDMQQHFSSSVKRLDSELADTKLMRDKVTGSTPADDRARAEYDFNLQQLGVMRDRAQQNLSEFDRAKTLREGLVNPVGFFSQLSLQRAAGEWALGKASIQSKKVEANQVYKWEQDARQDDFENRIAANKELRDQEKFNMEKSGTWPGDNNSGSRVNAQGQRVDKDGKPIQQDITYSSADASNLQYRSTLEAYQAHEQQVKNEVYSAAFQPEGMFRLLDVMPSMSDPITRVAVSSGMQKLLNGEFTGLSTEESKAIADFQTELFGKTITPGKFIGPQQTLDKAKEKIAQRLKVLGSNPLAATLSKEDLVAYNGYLQYQDARERYNSLQVEKERLFKEKISGNKEYSKIVVGSGKNARFITGEDIQADFEDLKLYPGSAGSFTSSEALVNGSRKYSRKELANLYSEGRLTFVPPGTGRPYAEALIDGNRYTVAQVGNLASGKDWTGNDPGADRLNKLSMELQKKYGTSAHLKDLKTKAAVDIIPNAVQYQKQTGKEGSVYTLHGNYQYNAAIEAAQPGNLDGIYVDGSPDIDEDQRRAIQAVLSSEDRAKQYLSNITYGNEGPDGKPYIGFFINEMPDKDKASGTLGNLENKQVRITLSPKAQNATYLGKLPTAYNSTFFSQLREGKPIVADEYMKAMGCNFQVVPNSTSDPSKVTVYFYPSEFNDKPGTEGYGTRIDRPARQQDFYLSDNTPYEIMNWVYTSGGALITDNHNKYEQYQLKNVKK